MVVVMGLGTSGVAALALLKRNGFENLVGVDLCEEIAPIEGVRLELGPHQRTTFLSADRIVVSPGIPLSQPDLVAAREAGVEIVGEVGLATRLALQTDVPRVAITGTNGKSTTTHFVGQLFSALGMNPFVGGNLGNPLSNADLDEHGAYVVELSSYQLESAGLFRADVGIVLNLTPDHLARHRTMEGYAQAKARLFRAARSTDIAMIPAHDPWITSVTAGSRGVRTWIGSLPGVLRDGNKVVVALGDRSASFDLSELSVPGEHNRDNAAVALFAVWAITDDVASLQEAVPQLRPLAHRMEVVRTVGGVRWINDSKSTNIASTIAALRGRDTPTVLLLGGKWKGTGYGQIGAHLDAVRVVICFGEDGPKIADELKSCSVPVRQEGGMIQALQVAAAVAQEGDDVLLSPGCASFDEFCNFEHRGQEFARWVESL